MLTIASDRIGVLHAIRVLVLTVAALGGMVLAGCEAPPTSAERGRDPDTGIASSALGTCPGSAPGTPAVAASTPSSVRTMAATLR